MLKRIILAGVAVAAMLVGAAAANDPGRPGVMTIRGACSELVAGNEEYSSNCNGEVASVTFADGTVMFIFSAGGLIGPTVGFSGSGREVTPGAGGVVILPISFVSVGLANQEPKVVPASGECRFTDPFQPEPALVECRASTAMGPAIGLFRSDGAPPQRR